MKSEINVECYAFADETKREREFYRARGLPNPKDILPNPGEVQGEKANADAHAESDYHRTDEQVQLSLLFRCFWIMGKTICLIVEKFDDSLQKGFKHF